MKLGITKGDVKDVSVTMILILGFIVATEYAVKGVELLWHGMTSEDASSSTAQKPRADNKKVA